MKGDIKMNETIKQAAVIDFAALAKLMREQLDYPETEPYTWLTTVNILAALLKSEDGLTFHEFRNACGFLECTGIQSEKA